LSRDVEVDELVRKAVGANSIIEPLRREMVKTLLLISVEGVKWGMFTRSPGLQLGKEGCEITPLNAELCSSLAVWEDRLT
jgi:hypothetical protein